MIENLENVYVDTSLILVNKLKRITVSGARYYFDEMLIPRMGITSFLGKVLPTSEALIQWRIDNAGDEKIKFERANYGTMFHKFAADILRVLAVTKKIIFDADGFFAEYAQYCKMNNREVSQYDYKELISDLCSLISWIETYNVRPILIETSLNSQNMQLAATLDLVAYIDIETKGFWGEVYKSGEKKGEPKESKRIETVLAVIDFKSMIKSETEEPKDRKVISLSNEFQLNYQRLFFTDNFPEFKDKEIKMFNVIPKDWRTDPDCQMSEIKAIPDSALYNLYELAKYYHVDLTKSADKKIPIFSGKYKNSISDIVSIKTLKEIIEIEINKTF